MDELREKIKGVIYEEFGLLIADDSPYDAVPGIVEGILSIPEIAEALALRELSIRQQGESITEAVAKVNLGHSIGTNKRTPV